jgi:photosystem II stability/assembly factor-like uncharacterized protein
MKRFANAVKLLAVVLSCLALAVAAGAGPSAADQPNPIDKLKRLEFRELGPAVMGGRVDDIAVVESNTNIVYIGMAAGGVWKTANNGTTWEPVFDKEGNPSIGDIAIAPSDPSVVWVGTGEPNNRQSSSWGDGIYKSLDAGKTWQKMGLEATHHIGRIVIHPRNPDVVYAAALGHLWGPNPERGVYKTADGGKTWSQVLKLDEDTGVSDIAMDPESPDILYAAAYQRRRTPFGFNGGGPGGAIYKTTDGGATWKKLTKGLPYEEGSGDVGRIALDVYRKNSNIVYALVQHEHGGIYRSEDKGETWKKMGDTNPRPSYFSQVRIDPNNDLRIWVCGAPMYNSEDGGKTFTTDRVRTIHVDFHALWIDPANSNHMITGSDGGIHFSDDAGKNWTFFNTFAIGQFYEIAYDFQKPYHICGGLQDNGSWCGPTQTALRDGIANEDWTVVQGGDGFYAQIDPVEPWIVYAESQDGHLARRDLRTTQARSLMPKAKEGEPHYRFQWNSPVAVSAHDHNTIYYGGNFLFKSADRGDSWTRLGGDLTTGSDRSKLPIFGKVPDKNTLARNDGVQEYPTITTISESPVTPSVLWVGTDDGNLQVSRDAGKSWKNVAARVPGVPKGTYVSRVTASKAAEGTAYAAFDGHRSDDYNIYLFMTTDYGENWKPIRNGISNSAGALHVVREHPRNPNLLFVGTEFGLWISWNRGANWIALKNNFPTVPVDDIAIQPRENDLLLATHGRSFWVLDDITALEKWSPEVAASDLTLFEPRTAITYHLAQRRWSAGQNQFTAKNPPYGALLTYYLKEAIPPEPPRAEGEGGERPTGGSGGGRRAAAEERAATAAGQRKEGRVKFFVYDKDGKLVREMEGPGAAGVNRTNWDLRWNPPAEPTPEQLEAVALGFGFGPRGPLVEPGKYTVKVKAGTKEASQDVVVEDDPRVQISAEDRAARHDAVMKLYEMAKSADRDRRTITGLRDALTTAREQWKQQAARPNGVKIPEEIRKAAEELQKKVEAVSEKFARPPQALGNAGPPLEWKPEPLPNRVQDLLQDLDGFDAAPGGQQKELLAELGPLVAAASAQVKQVVEEDLAALNKKMNEAGIPHIVPAPGGPRQGRGPQDDDDP